MKKVFVLLISSLILFSDCVCIGSRDLIFKPVNVVLRNFDITEAIIVKLDISSVTNLYAKKLSKKENKILDLFLVNNQIDDEILIQPQKKILKKIS